jgi:predicted MPP superfamily phosphohydrolase
MTRKKTARRLPVALMLLLLAGVWFVWQQNGIATEVFRVSSSRLPPAFDQLRIVQVSDLHGKEFGKDSKGLLEKISQLKPDLIAVTGDLIDREEQLAMVPPLAEGLAAIAPTFYVTGNHEWAVRRVNDLKTLLEDCGVTVLSGEGVTWEREGQTLAIAGVDDPNGPADQMTGEALREKLTADYTILLSHRDTVFDYAGWGYDLVLCGHGHGGILRIPLWDRGLLGTDRTLFPLFDGGKYGFASGGTCILSRGLGNNTVPLPAFRLFNRPHLPLIILTRES